MYSSAIVFALTTLEWCLRLERRGVIFDHPSCKWDQLLYRHTVVGGHLTLTLGAEFRWAWDYREKERGRTLIHNFHSESNTLYIALCLYLCTNINAWLCEDLCLVDITVSVKVKLLLSLPSLKILLSVQL